MGIARYEKRLMAYLFDQLLALLLGVGLFVVLIHYGVMEYSSFLNFLLSALFSYAMYFLLVFFVSYLSGGRSFGFMVFGIKAIHADGDKFRARDAAIRSLVSGVIVAMLASAIYMLSVHTERSPIDRLTSTLVIDVRR